MKKILIVEDQTDVLKLLGVVLGAKDRKVLLTESAEEAVEIAREVIPDVVLMDVMLPGNMDGYEATRTLKKDPTTSGCSIIIMTAKVQEQDKLDAFEAGADDYIGKPFNLDELKNKIAKLIQ